MFLCPIETLQVTVEEDALACALLDAIFSAGIGLKKVGRKQNLIATCKALEESGALPMRMLALTEMLEAYKAHLGLSDAQAFLQHSLLIDHEKKTGFLLEHSPRKQYPSGNFGKFKKAFPVGQFIFNADSGVVMGVKIQAGSFSARGRALESEAKLSKGMNILSGSLRRTRVEDEARDDKDYQIQALLPGIGGERFVQERRRRGIQQVTRAQGEKLFTSVLANMEMLQALEHYHRDIKPSNVFIDPDTYQVFFLDFGSAVKFDSKSTLYRGGYAGTLEYSSTKQIMQYAFRQKNAFSYEDELLTAVYTMLALSGLIPRFSCAYFLLIESDKFGQQVSPSDMPASGHSEEEVKSFERQWVQLANNIIRTDSFDQDIKILMLGALLCDSRKNRDEFDAVDRILNDFIDHQTEGLKDNVWYLFRDDSHGDEMDSPSLNREKVINFLRAQGRLGAIQEEQKHLRSVLEARHPVLKPMAEECKDDALSVLFDEEDLELILTEGGWTRDVCSELIQGGSPHAHTVSPPVLFRSHREVVPAKVEKRPDSGIDADGVGAALAEQRKHRKSNGTPTLKGAAPEERHKKCRRLE